MPGYKDLFDLTGKVAIVTGSTKVWRKRAQASSSAAGSRNFVTRWPTR
jgi:hypothetical protein